MSVLRDLPEKITRRKVQIVLGLLWLLDGALQFQPKMFTSKFITDVISPAGLGQPRFVTGPMNFAIHIFLFHPVFFDLCIGLVQLGLGIFILFKKTTRYAIIASVFWALFVWYIGEGLGGLAGGQAMLMMGAPGAALLYAIIGIAVMPPKGSKTSSDTKPAYWLSIVWVVYWLGGAALQLESGQNTSAYLGSMVSSMAGGAPRLMSSLDFHLGTYIQSSGSWVIAFLVLAQTLIGILVLLPQRFWRSSAVLVGIGFSLVYWVVGQSLGGYYTGLATDPSTGPLIILLGIAILGSGNQIYDYIQAVV